MALPLETLLRRDRWLLGGGLAGIVALAWGYLLTGAGTGMTLGSDLEPMAAGAAMAPAAWTPAYTLTMFSMWWIMMVAMMLPSAAPTILLAAAINRRSGKSAPLGATGAFVGGYLLAWAGFSLAAVLAQRALSTGGALATMKLTSPLLAGVLLIAAGVWQLTPLKRSCLGHCRSPIRFLTRRRGAPALALGLEHGGYCLGCCWSLMTLLFVGGVMNLLWVAGLAGFVLVEKLMPLGGRFGRFAGVALALSGVAVLAVAV